MEPSHSWVCTKRVASIYVQIVVNEMRQPDLLLVVRLFVLCPPVVFNVCCCVCLCLCTSFYGRPAEIGNVPWFLFFIGLLLYESKQES